MRLFIDECLSPVLALRLNDTGLHDAIHPLHVGRRGEPDHRVLARCIAEDRVVVSENARDFRQLVGAASIHPGLILLPETHREGTWNLLLMALSYLCDRGDPADLMVNRVLEIDEAGAVAFVLLPSD